MGYSGRFGALADAVFILPVQSIRFAPSVNVDFYGELWSRAAGLLGAGRGVGEDVTLPTKS